MQKVFLLIVFSIALLIVNAQNDIDSLKTLLQSKTKDDSIKADLLLQIGISYQETDLAISLQYLSESEKVATAIGNKKGIAMALKSKGLSYYFQDQYFEAIKTWNQTLEYVDTITDRVTIARVLSNIGLAYSKNGDEAKALDNHLKALKVGEEIKDTLRIVTALNNIGVVYMIKKDNYDKALTYLLRALPLGEKIGSKPNIGSSCINLGELYFSRGDNDKALFYFQKSLEAYKNTEAISASLNDIGKVYTSKGDFINAKKYHDQAYEIANKLSVKSDMAMSLLGLADIYVKQNKYANALPFFKHAETIASEIRSFEEMKNAYDGLSTTYSKLGDYTNAFKYQTLLLEINKTIYNTQTDKKLLGLQFDFEIEKKQGQINLLEKDKALQDLNLRRQKLAKNAFITGFLLVLIITFIIYKNYRAKIKTNLILDSQKAEIENLLLNILPAEVAKELQRDGHTAPRYYESVSVLFTDFKGFTKLAADLSPQEVVYELDSCFIAFDEIIEKHGLEKIKTIGDSYMCAGGIPTRNDTHPVNIIKASLDIRDFMNNWNEDRKTKGLPLWELRIGVNTGPVVAGVVGRKKYAYDIWGKTVNVASRMESNGEPGQVNISDTTYELVKDNFACTYRGKISAKNVGEIDMYFVDNDKN